MASLRADLFMFLVHQQLKTKVQNVPSKIVKTQLLSALTDKVGIQRTA